MNDLYWLLYLLLAVFAALWLMAAIKLAIGFRKHSPKSLQNMIGAEFALGLFIIGFAIMVVTHARDFKIAMLFIMAMACVNFLRAMILLKSNG